jgi:ferrous iron transport protein A
VRAVTGRNSQETGSTDARDEHQPNEKGVTMIPLGLLSTGECGEIAEIRIATRRGSCCEKQKCDCRIEDLGLRIGKTVHMLNNGSPVLLKVDESRIAVDRSMAMKILIKEVVR